MMIKRTRSFWVIIMRVLFLICLLATLATSCSRSGVALKAGGKFSVVERRSIIAIHPSFAGWEPSESAFWTRRGVMRHICLREGGFGSISMPYWVFVFDGEGRVVEANIIHAPNPCTAEAVSSVSPLQVAFKARDGRIYVGGGEFSQTTWRYEMKKEMDLMQKRQEIIETWRRSGSTNFSELDRMMQSAITNSTR